MSENEASFEFIGEHKDGRTLWAIDEDTLAKVSPEVYQVLWESKNE